MNISVIIPVYGAPNILEELVSRLSKVLTSITTDFEIILVNDACPKGSWSVISNIIKQGNRNVVGMNLSRNFGQHRAIAAGLNYCSGDYAIVMDCDLQDVPEEILKLVAKAQEGYDVVFGRRAVRQDSFFKKFTANLYYRLFNYLTGFTTDPAVANFSIISRKVIDSYNTMPEQNRPYSYFISWLGFNRQDIDIQHSARPEGKSSYTFSKLLEFAIDNIISETNRPLKIGIKIGFIFSLLSFLFGVFLCIKWYLGDVVEGWTSVVVSIFFTSGMIMANFGLLGLYLGKTFDETKRRPLYIISDIERSSTNNADKELSIDINTAGK
ncbi:glycosyltransferase family 2 protein [Vibrio rhizosphaerae]|uniref:glycosyltransferase family 2 protein n=1 Tax=Vibrio rhizosphaerae TaxID=398736 RepID=UPI000A4DA664|nr:glycosyltransferase family 2 protein [Vibrio rhizosphaerae]